MLGRAFTCLCTTFTPVISFLMPSAVVRLLHFISQKTSRFFSAMAKHKRTRDESDYNSRDHVRKTRRTARAIMKQHIEYEDPDDAGKPLKGFWSLPYEIRLMIYDHLTPQMEERKPKAIKPRKQNQQPLNAANITGHSQHSTIPSAVQQQSTVSQSSPAGPTVNAPPSPVTSANPPAATVVPPTASTLLTALDQCNNNDEFSTFIARINAATYVNEMMKHISADSIVIIDVKKWKIPRHVFSRRLLEESLPSVVKNVRFVFELCSKRHCCPIHRLEDRSTKRLTDHEAMDWLRVPLDSTMGTDYPPVDLRHVRFLYPAAPAYVFDLDWDEKLEKITVKTLPYPACEPLVHGREIHAAASITEVDLNSSVRHRKGKGISVVEIERFAKFAGKTLDDAYSHFGRDEGCDCGVNY